MKHMLLVTTLVVASAACLDPSQSGNLVPRTVDDDPTLPRLALNGSLFHAEAFGDPSSPVIVVLHSGPGHDYRSLAITLRQPVDGVRLEDRHRVVFWDQRSAGLSRRHEERDVDIDTYDADLLALVDTFSAGRPVVLLGKSWGGMFAANFISRHPGRVAGAVLMEPGPLTKALFEDVKGGIQNLDLGSDWLNDAAWAGPVVSSDDHARADYALLLAMLGDSQPGFHISTTNREPLWRLGAVAWGHLQSEGIKNGWDFTTGLGRFTRPVLFEASDQNEVIGIAFQRRQMTAFPNASLAIVPGAGHDFNWTQPEATLRPVLSYLAAIGF
jgi:proline iminopeptidase